MPILIFPNCKEFHVHVDGSSIALGALLVHPREGDLNNPIDFSRRKLFVAENNYTTIEREGLEMVYDL